MLRLALLGALVLAGCSKNDRCKQFVDKSAPVLRKIGGDKITDAKLDELVEMCRSKPANKDKELMDCVLGAADEAAVSTCWQTGFKSYADSAKRNRDSVPAAEPEPAAGSDGSASAAP